jgi:hypothetical protein
MIAAFDMGIKNFAFAVKKGDDFILLKTISLTDKIVKSDLNHLKKDELSEMMSNLNISKPDKIVKNDMIDLILVKTKKSSKHVDLGISMFQIMDDYRHYWNDCDTFLIERQMTINLQALKLSHYLEAYLKIHYPEKKILNYDASMKTKKLGAEKLKTKKDRKKWTIEFASTVLRDENLGYYQALNKKDDIADVVCMIEAYQSKNN